MKRIWRSSGEYYASDYTIGSDPVMKHIKVKIEGNVIEAQVLAAIAKTTGVDPTQINIYQTIQVRS